MAFLILFFFITPSLLYASTSFQFFSEEHGPRKSGYEVLKKYFKYTNENRLDINVTEYEGYRFFFYYYNYEKYKDYLSEFKGITYAKFKKKINEN